MPEVTFICVSFDNKLALMNARLARDIIASDEYRELFGDYYQIRNDTDGAGLYMTDRGGFRLSTSTGSNITGYKGLIIICLPEGQEILTNLGYLDIKDIVEQEKKVEILSFNHKTQKNEWKNIKRYDKNTGRRLIKLKTSSKEMICTEEHEIWTENRGYVMAKDLTVEDILRIED